ncbi:MAG: NapC/NirT family cytochrome c [Acidobacteria bacterium]|nr:NapC/NirT family cytochrome c [Acidobacteriota bacterium]
MRSLIRLPAAARNLVSLVGAAMATAMAVLFLVLLLLDLLGYVTNPYIGLLVFVTVPVLFVAGLLLIPAGIWWDGRRRAPGEAPDWPVIDLRNARQRSVAVGVLALTIVNLVIVSMAAYGGVHYMESSEFCGQVCHTTMEPEYAAYQAWPHAQVACTACHVGPGAGALAESKLAGTRQLLQVATGRVARPVPSPVRTMRPARETCEQCHWPEKFHGDRTRTIREYASDEANTESVTTLRLHVGGGSRTLGVGTGIHWHMNLDNEIEYVATDERRETIPYVRLTDREGRVREFAVEGTTAEQLAGGERRRMDCLDCHNRPAHTFSPTPERAVDGAIAQGRVPRELPFVRREAVAAVGTEYATRVDALEGIARVLTEFYAGRTGADARLVARAVAAAQDVWSRNVFPVMNVSWGTYPNHLGHLEAPGCFRCHDDEHRAADGSVIRQGCEVCHSFE